MQIYEKTNMASSNVDSTNFTSAESSNELIIVESDESSVESPAITQTTSWDTQKTSLKHKAQEDDWMDKPQKKSKTTNISSTMSASSGVAETLSSENKDALYKHTDEEASVPNLATRWPHQPQPQAMRSSLLEKVLNQKKMVLMQSPEVIKWLQETQSAVEENFQSAPHSKSQEKGSKHKAWKAPHSIASQNKVDEKCVQGSNCGEKSTKNQPETHKEDSGSGDNKTFVTHSIWSREGSAFSSVSRINQQK